LADALRGRMYAKSRCRSGSDLAYIQRRPFLPNAIL
jgi:hypothetical protein